MTIKKNIANILVKNDLVPMKFRWKKSVSGVGTLYKDIYYMLDKRGKQNLRKLMYKEGFEQAKDAIKTLEIDKGIKDCALALMAAHRVWGIKSNIVKETDNEVIIHCTDCMWCKKKGWTPAVCASIEAFESGLVEGINKKIKHFYTKRRSLGDKYCEMVLKVS
jgi:hypothetical protein